MRETGSFALAGSCPSAGLPKDALFAWQCRCGYVADLNKMKGSAETGAVWTLRVAWESMQWCLLARRASYHTFARCKAPSRLPIQARVPLLQPSKLQPLYSRDTSIVRTCRSTATLSAASAEPDEIIMDVSPSMIDVPPVPFKSQASHACWTTIHARIDTPLRAFLE